MAYRRSSSLLHGIMDNGRLHLRLPLFNMVRAMIQQAKRFKKFHIVISGFLQNEGKPNGMIRLWGDLYAGFARGDSLVMMKTWNDNMDSLAEFIWRMTDDDPVIKVYGYSWGGAAAVKLAKALKKRGLYVVAMVLSDAVYRHSYWLGNWRAFIPFFKIVVPNNVKIVWWFRQKSKFGKLSGHDIVADQGGIGFDKVIVTTPTWCNCSHTYMDDNRLFQNKVLNVARV